MEEKIDARSLPREVLEEKRRQAHRLRKRGMTRAEIGEIVGVHADTVGRWLKLPSRQIKVNRGGRKKGEGRRLTQAQADRLRKLITDKAPDQLKLNYALWTRKAVMELIEQETGVVGVGGSDAVGMADAGAVAVGVLQGTTAIRCEVLLS